MSIDAANSQRLSTESKLRIVIPQQSLFRNWDALLRPVQYDRTWERGAALRVSKAETTTQKSYFPFTTH